MANDIAGRPWRLDTPNPAIVIWPTWMHIEGIEFVSYSVQGSVAELLDINGRLVWRATGTDDLQPVRFGKIGAVNGLVLSQCENGGVVIVYIK